MKKRKCYSSLDEAKVAVKKKGIQSQSVYRIRYKEDPLLPSKPNEYYAGEWISWFDLFGTEKKKFYGSLAQAQKAAGKLDIHSQNEYNKKYKLDPKLPSRPDVAYQNEWVSWNPFLGKDKKNFYSNLSQACLAVKKLKINGFDDYKLRYKEDPCLPCNPASYYLKEWISWNDLFGKVVKNFYPTLQEAQLAVKQLSIDTQKKYKANYKKDPRLPSSPNIFYKEEWVSWSDLFGKETAEFYTTLLEAQKAARALKFTSIIGYKRGYKIDPKLPSSPDARYANDWRNWPEFLGIDENFFYGTLAEAKSCAKKLGINSSGEYGKRYKEDPLLPSNPHNTYQREWVSWYDFLDKEHRTIYPRLDEAKKAVQARKIKSFDDYTLRYKDDPSLPASPQEYYKNEWKGWPDFLGKEVKEFYSSLALAKHAVMKLGVDCSRDYHRVYRRDPHLPANPDSFYENEWGGWPDFFGRNAKKLYETYQEAHDAAITLGIVTSKEYAIRYSEDPRLPARPHSYYSDDWSNWLDFLNTNDHDRWTPFEKNVPEWCKMIRRWLEGETALPSKEATLTTFLTDLVLKNGLPDYPPILLHKDTNFDENAYKQYILNSAESLKRPRHRHLIAFFDWVLNEYCSEEYDGEIVRLNGYRNPLKTLLSGFVDELPTNRHSQSVKPPLGIEYVERARRWLIPEGAKTLSDLPHLRQQLFNGSYDWFDVDKSVIDRQDPNCIWRCISTKRNDESVKIYQIWSPTRFIALYALLRIPLRGQQILWLDSGEADKLRVSLNTDGTMTSNLNTGALSGKGKTGQQGVIQPARDGSEGASLYITTNKTGRESGGYWIDWAPEDLIYWLLLLRDWQEKYNPLKEISEWSKIKVRQKINKKILLARGKQVFLFREPGSDKGSPVATTTAFSHTLPELLYIIQRLGEVLSERLKLGRSFRFKSPYTPHSMRVSLITAYVVDGKAPISIVSKLVGHASIVMTIYYTKVNAKAMRETLGEAEKRAAMKGHERLSKEIFGQNFDQIKNQLIGRNEDFFNSLDNSWPGTAYQITDRGICPMSGASCDVGGEPVAERKTEVLYTPVEPGYLGKRNCVRCRYFITGPAFLGGLLSLLNELSLEIETERERYQKAQLRVEELENLQYDCERSDTPFLHGNKLRQAQSEYEESSCKLDMYLCDFTCTHRLITRCFSLLNKPTEKNGKREGNYDLIATDAIGEIGLEVCESDSNFRLLSEICLNATIYTGANPSRAIPKRSLLIDRMADNNGLEPTMFRLSEEHQLEVGNQLTQLLLKRLKSWTAVDQLFTGQKLLNELYQDASLQPLDKDVQALLSGGSINFTQYQAKIETHD